MRRGLDVWLSETRSDLAADLRAGAAPSCDSGVAALVAQCAATATGGGSLPHYPAVTWIPSIIVTGETASMPRRTPRVPSNSASCTVIHDAVSERDKAAAC